MDTIKNIIENFVPENITIIEYNDFSNSGRFKIVIDGENNVDLNTTSTIAKNIKKSKLVNEMFPDGVQLEITSPGIDSKLIFPFQYQKNINRMLNISTYKSEKSFYAKLVSATDTSIKIKFENGNSTKLDYKEIDSANVIIKI